MNDIVNNKISKIMKILTIIFMALVFIGILMPDAFVLTFEPHELDPKYVPQAIIRWLQFVSFLVLPIIAFFNKDVFKKIAIYFCLPVSIIYLCFYNEMLGYHVSELGRGIYQIRYLPQAIKDFMINPVFRGMLIIVPVILEIATIVLMVIKSSELFKKFDVFKFNNWKSFATFLLVLITTTISIIPVYVPQHLFGYSNFILKMFSLAHFVWIFFLVGEIIVLRLIFKNQSYENRYIVLLILALSLFVQYNQLFSRLGELTFKRMPFQLCNIAAYLAPIMLVTKNKKLFHFSLMVNVAGGIIALIVMDAEKKGIFAPANVHYMAEHNNVIVIPILCLLLNIFEPLKKKDFKDFVIEFTCYWGFILVFGTILNGIYKITGSDYFKVNYLFMFQKDTMEGLVPFLTSWFDVQIKIGEFVLYPLIQLLVYFGLMLLCFIIFFIILKCTNRNKKQLETTENI